MANQEHLEILAHGVSAWNKRYKANFAVSSNLAKADLSKADLRVINLRGVILSKANIHDADLREVDLSEADLSEADLSQSNLSEAGLNRTNLRRANLRGAMLSGAILTSADLREVDLTKVDLIKADLSEANLSGANLSGANLTGADLRGAKLNEVILCGADLNEANLSWTNLSGANFIGAVLGKSIFYEADLSKAILSKAILSDADLTGADLSDADLTGADLSRAILSFADLRNANLSGANLSGANLSDADLGGADLSGANLTRADLRKASCNHTDFSKAILSEARLIDTNLTGATLNGACLWETQRAEWTIKGVVCTNVYWDKEGNEITNLRPGEFERLYAEKVRILIEYPNGITPLEIATLPALIQHLEASRPGCRLRFESIQDAPGGAVVTVTVEDIDETSSEQIQQFRAAIQSEAEQKAQYLRQALEGERQATLLLKGEVQALERLVNNLFSNQKPTYYLETGDIHMSEFKNTIHGNFQGAMGDNAQAQNLTYNEIGSQIEKSMDLSQLAVELLKLRQAMNEEAQESSHYIAMGEVAKAEEAAKAKDSSKMVENLKSAGKWALDVATKIGVPLATEALKQSIGMK